MNHYAPALSGAIELKSAEDDTSSEDIVTKALDDLTKTVDERLKGVEEKAAKADKIADRLDKLELKISRPAIHVGTADEQRSLETKAFERYLRSGTEGMDALERKALRVADDAAAGYLVTGEFLPELDKNITLNNPIRQVATVRQTTAPNVTMLRRTTAATASWVGEDEDRSEATPQYSQQNYPVYELATFVDVSLQLLEDSAIDIQAELAAEFGEAFGYSESAAFVTGSGSKRPLGFMNDTSLSYTPGGDASALKADGLIDLFHAVKPPYRLNGVWLMNSATLATARKLKDSSGQYLLQTAPGFAQTPAPTILGRPVLECPDLPDVAGNAYPVVFGDFGVGFRIFDRIPLSLVRDDYTQRAKGRVRFHGRRRVAAGVRRAEAIRKLKIATS